MLLTRRLIAALLLLACCFSAPIPRTSAAEVRLVTLDPGHFHAGLVQKFMYPEVSPVVHVYAPPGADLQEHLRRIQAFNSRPENPTRWEERVYTGPDFLQRMLRERAGNVLVLAGNNTRKPEYIRLGIKAGFNVLADKPMAIDPAGFRSLRKAFEEAAKKRVLLYDIMTERHEVTIVLQRALSRMPELFGNLREGSIDEPAVVMESVHHFFKEVAGAPLIRPAWFYDVRQEGEAIPDVGTHLVDLVLWECFPEQPLDWRKDIRVLSARRWPTKLKPEQFKRSTGVEPFPDFLKKDLAADGSLNVYQNGEVHFAVRGVHASVKALWNFEAPPGATDSHYSLLRGTRANLMIRQGPDEQYQPALYVENTSGCNPAVFEHRVRTAVGLLEQRWPELTISRAGDSWRILVPNKYNVGHEAHFAQVTEHFLRCMAEGKLPDWEIPVMLSKYHITAEAYRLSHSR